MKFQVTFLTKLFSSGMHFKFWIAFPTPQCNVIFAKGTNKNILLPHLMRPSAYSLRHLIIAPDMKIGELNATLWTDINWPNALSLIGKLPYKTSPPENRNWRLFAGIAVARYIRGEKNTIILPQHRHVFFCVVLHWKILESLSLSNTDMCSFSFNYARYSGQLNRQDMRIIHTYTL